MDAFAVRHGSGCHVCRVSHLIEGVLVVLLELLDALDLLDRELGAVEVLDALVLGLQVLLHGLDAGLQTGHLVASAAELLAELVHLLRVGRDGLLSGLGRLTQLRQLHRRGSGGSGVWEPVRQEGWV